MKNFLISLMCIFCVNTPTLKIVYPKTNPAKVNASSTFFIGSTKPSNSLTINGIPVKVSPSGVFAHVVPLNVGLNNFKIVSINENAGKIASVDTFSKGDASKSHNELNNFSDGQNIYPSRNDESVIYFEIERAQPKAAPVPAPVLIEYPAINDFYVKSDNAPLRSTPIDGGINRMAHLPKGIPVFINGEKGDFYRTYLNSKLSGWIAKSDVDARSMENNEPLPIRIKDFKVKEDNEFYIYEFDLGGKSTPFIIKEENGLTLQLFNILGQNDGTFSLNVPVEKIMGYDAYYEDKWWDNCGEKFILKVRKIPQINPERPLEGIRIVVDAGHGGKELCAIGGFGDSEKDINLAIAKELQIELKRRGAKVIMTRNSDIDLPLYDRVKIAKEKNAALFLSIHANAVPDGADPNTRKGTGTYYYYDQAKPLAESILSSMTTQLHTQNDKVNQKSLAVVRNTSSISVLVEVAYIINPDDYMLLLDKNFQVNCAKAISDGIEKYLLN